jgi:hypothetical protein
MGLPVVQSMICLDLPRKSGEASMMQEDLHVAIEAVYEGI